MKKVCYTQEPILYEYEGNIKRRELEKKIKEKYLHHTRTLLHMFEANMSDIYYIKNLKTFYFLTLIKYAMEIYSWKI